VSRTLHVMFCKAFSKDVQKGETSPSVTM